MITLKSLKLRNFLSHENTELVFDEQQKLLIDGQSGSGKSTILEAIIWAFYGVGRSSNTSLIRRGSEKATVVLVLDHDGREVTIHRSISNTKHNLEIEIDGVANPLTGVKALQEYIETELTGASYMLFVNSIAYLQGGAESFVGQNAGKRKELLLEIIKTIDFDTYYNKTKAKISEKENDKTIVDTLLSGQTEALATAESEVLKKPEIEALITKTKEDIASYDQERSILNKVLEGRSDRQQKLSEKSTAIQTRQRKIDSVKVTIDDSNRKLTALQNQIAIPESDIASLVNERETLKTKLSSIHEAIGSIAKMNAERVVMLQNKPTDRGFEGIITALTHEIESMSSSNLCPEGDNCPNFKATRERIVSKQEERSRIEAAYEQYKTDITEWEKKFNLMEEISVADLQIEEKSVSLSVSVLDEQIKQQEQRKSAMEQVALINETQSAAELEMAELSTAQTADMKELEQLMAQSDTAEETLAIARLVELDSVTSALNEVINLQTQKLGVINNYAASIPDIKEKISGCQTRAQTLSTELRQLELLKDAFGSKGIRALVIDYIIPELEEKINEILSQMSEFRVLLDTQQEKSSGDGSKEGLFITIVNDMGEEMPFENYSGGEKLKIVVAITEALATLQRCGFRLFDETWVGLDEMSLESFTQVLDTLLQRFPQVICVSHLTEIKSAFDDKITVTKHNGVSQVN